MSSQPIEASPTRSAATGWRAWLIGAALVVIVAAAFYPSLGNGFNYDDETNIVRNMRFRGLGSEQLRWMFTTFKAGHYQPLSWMSLALDYLLWGDEPFGYHLTNLILHAANTVLVFWLAWILIRVGQSPTPEGWGTLLAAGAAALLFAVHPLRVESVAWVTERRDVLSSFFLLATVLLYLRAMRAEGRAQHGWMAASLFVFALSLLSRAMGVTLPLILLVLDWYPLGRFARREKKGSGAFASHTGVAGGGRTDDQSSPPKRQRLLTPFWWTPLVEKIPFLVLAAAAAVVAPMAQKSVGAAALLEHHGIEARISQAFFGLVFYVWKTILPWGLVPMYELHPPLRFLTLKYGMSAAAVVVALVLLIWGRRRRALVAAVLCYAILLSPVLGFGQSGQQEVADRYSYLPAVVIALLVGGGIARLRAARLTPAVQRMRGATVAVGICGVVVALCVLTRRQCRVWYSPETLWSHAIAHGPPCATAHFNLGSVYGQQGRTPEAKVQYIKALDVNPRYPEAYYNLGNAYTQLGELRRAEKAYLGALEINKNHVTARFHLGNALIEQGKNEPAAQAYREAIRLRGGNYPEGWYQLGNAAANQGRTDEAIEAYREAIRLRPEYVEARINLGNQYWKKQEMESAIESYREALRLEPKHVDARVNLAGVLASDGRTEEAVAELREALSIDPNHAEAQRRLKVLEGQLERAPP